MAKQSKKAPKEPVQKPKVEATQPAKVVSETKDIFEHLGGKAPLVALGLIFLVGFLVFKDYLLGDKVYLFKDIGSDTLNVYYPFICGSADYLHFHGLPEWSFSYGMGQNTISALFSDPFNVILYAMGKDHIMQGMMLKEFVKILLGGLVFFYYLRSLKLGDYTAILGSLIFAFCGFMILGSGWYVFTTEAFDLVLLLWSFELLYTKGKWLLFPLTIFLISISNPFDLYVCGLFTATYVLLRLYQTDNFNLKSIALTYGKMIGLGLLGMLLAAPFLAEIITQMLESPRGNGTNSYAHILSSMPMFQPADKLQLGTGVMRLFNSDLLGSGNSFKGWQNFLEAPIFYCGIPCLLLMPQVFRFLDKKVKIFFIAFISLWLLPVIFPWFRYAFWLFTGDYYRAYSMIVAFLFIYYGMHALDLILKHRKINLIALIVTAVLLLILLNYPYFPEKDYVNSGLLAIVGFLVVVYGALLFFIGKPGSSPYLKYGLMVAVIFELTYFSSVTANERDAVTTAEAKEKVGYNDYSVDAISFIKKNDAGFYRIDKTYGSSPAMHMSLNDGMVQGYRGTSGYSSFNQEYYVKYLQLMGISNRENELESRWANGLAFRPILESQNQVKYILAKKIINPIWKIACDSLGSFGDVKLYRNKFVLPLGYTYNSFIKESIFDKLTSVQKDFVSLRACVVGDKDINKAAGLKEFQLKDTFSAFTFTADLYKGFTNELSKDTLAIDKIGETLISGKVNASEDKMMYLSVPYDAGWTLKVDGQPTEKIILDGGMTGVMLKKGQHTIEMAYHLRYFKKGTYASIAGIVILVGLFFFTRGRKKTEEAVA